jgi:hypothetical protein
MKGMRKGEVVAYFKVIYQHSSGGNRGKRRKSSVMVRSPEQEASILPVILPGIGGCIQKFPD